MRSGLLTGRLAAFVKGLGALVLLAVVVAGIPWALWHFIGWPLPHHVPTAAQVGRALDRQGIPAQILVDALAVVVWLTWATLVVSIAAEVRAAVAGRRPRRLPVAGLFQPLTGRLVAAVVIATLTLTPRTGHVATASLGEHLQTTVRRPVATLVVREAVRTGGDGNGTAPLARATTPTTSGDHAPPAAPSTIAASPRTYVVQRGDTLWGIAERELGDPLRWSEIFQLNEGRPEPDGEVLTDPHWIDPGWTLVLPQTSSASTPPVSPPPTSPPATTVPTGPTAPTHAHRPAPHQPKPTSAPQSAGRAAGAPLLLPSGSIIAGSFGAGVLSAIAARRMRRRRAYRPGEARPGARLSRPAPPTGLGHLLAASRADDVDRDYMAPPPSAPEPLTVVPEMEAIVRPDLIDVAHRGDQVVRLSLGDWPGLRLCGRGAEPALRALLAALVTRDGPYAAEVLLAHDLATRLLPDVELPSVQRVETLDVLLSRLETAGIGRTRRLERAEAPDANTYRLHSPEDPFPLLLAVIDEIPASTAPRWSALLSRAPRLGFAVVVLSPRLTTPTSLAGSGAGIVVGHDGAVESATPDALADHLAGASLFTLDGPSAAELLAPVAAVHNDAEPDDPQLSDELDDRLQEGTPSGVVVGAGVVSADTDVVVTPHDDDTTRAWSRPRSEPDDDAPITVDLFGPARVCAWGEEVRSGLRQSAYELLAWYALHPGGASAEAAIDALWPNAEPQRGRERFWTALGNLRSRLHGPSEDGVEILTRVGDSYRPDPSVLDVDLWRFEAALADAVGAANERQLVAALESAVAAYGGDLCPGADSFWVPPVREDLHRRALDAHVRLAECYEADQPERAVSVLEHTIEVDPICEDAYRRLLRLQVHLGRTDTARRTWRLLQGRLAELCFDPEEATEDLVHELFAPRPTTVRRLPKPPG